MTETISPVDEAQRLSTAPKPPGRSTARTPWQWAIWAWRLLTSMRTALLLLALLALAAIPGTVIPQRSLDPVKVDNYLAAHPHLGRLAGDLSLFNVFGAWWFFAIYMLLFVSLVGCVIPRLRLHAKALRRRPPNAPRHLSRLPVSTSWRVDDEARAVAERTQKLLRGSRWRADLREEPNGVVSVAAEKGYLRETGNLVFHLALLLLLLGIAGTGLYGYKGTALVVQGGDGFTNTQAEYDVFSPSRLFHDSQLSPFSFTLNKFTASYQSNGEPTSFDANISYQTSSTAAAKPYDIRVNHPLNINGAKVFLVGHGYAPHITVTKPNGQVAYSQNVAFLPDNSNFASHGVAKVTSTSKDLGILGFFYPTFGLTPAGTGVSTYPGLDDPVLDLVAETGDLYPPSAGPQSVYSLPTTGLTQIGNKELTPGQKWKLPNGDTIRFDGVNQWATFQVAHEPGKRIVLLAAVLIVAGLIGSLTVRRRRFWIRAVPAAAGDTDRRTVVTAAGLSRSDGDGFAAELDDLVDRINVDRSSDEQEG